MCRVEAHGSDDNDDTQLIRLSLRYITLASGYHNVTWIYIDSSCTMYAQPNPAHSME